MSTSKVMKIATLLACALYAGGCKSSEHVSAASSSHSLVGAWRSSVQFEGGDFAAVKDLRFVYIFHSDGTMIESSNYDAAPPVPPAYGVWRRTANNEYEARYIFFTTTPPADFDDLKKTGWSPAGCGVLLERIVLDADGDGFDSMIRLDMYDNASAPVGSPSIARARGERFSFTATATATAPAGPSPKDHAP